MIEVTCYRNQNRVTITGHANSDRYGKDLICAAVSALALTLSANVSHLADIGCVTDPVIKLSPGDGEISCVAVRDYRANVANIFFAICVGFEILAERYPEFISCRVEG